MFLCMFYMFFCKSEKKQIFMFFYLQIDVLNVYD